MILKNAKDQFYAELQQNIRNKKIESEEFSSFVSSHIGKEAVDDLSEFYEMCSTFSEISLNAPKYVDPQTCDVQASFQYDYINKAKVAFKKYIIEKGLKDIEG